ncbi:MAG: FtsX-like permease family protein [Clostridiaceae bacterium]|jgi:putative ABC transport system permease protein|nr:FtsX-like permease family protein [Clostridiaceae bacterium]
MKIIQSFFMAISSILSNKVRSFLTMLGVIIGVSAVIMLVSLGESAEKTITEQIEGMGSNLISVNIISIDRQIEEDDFMDLKNRYPNIIGGISPFAHAEATIKYKDNNITVFVEGVLEAYQDIVNLDVESGRFITNVDNDFRNRVAIIGSKVAEELFDDEPPLGKEIYIDGYKFKVVGILESASGSVLSDSSELIIIPLQTIQRMAKISEISTYYVQAASKETVDSAVAIIEDFLTQKLSESDSFTVFSLTQILDSVNVITQTFTLVLAGIAGISLLVGGIGIMNIMLVSVSERTREIGIRKAIGAKKRDIMSQFLIESSIVSGLGGVIGIILGVQGAKLIISLMDIQPTISPKTVIIAFVFSVCIGIVFGMYPANKAANLKPIDALSHE